MSNIIQFPQRFAAKPAPEPAARPAADNVVLMVKGAAAMQVVATLAFYASQGWDQGAKARAAIPAMRELLAQINPDTVVSPV